MAQTQNFENRLLRLRYVSVPASVSSSACPSSWKNSASTDRIFTEFDILCIYRKLFFILVINQLEAQNFCFTISLFHASACFEHYVLIIRRSKLRYGASGIITPIGGRPFHRCTGRPPTECDDTRSCIIQF